MNKWWNSLLVVGVLGLVSACAGDKQPAEQKPAPQTLTTQPQMLDVEVAYRDDAPQRYIVKPGDTLWEIAAKFLKNPGYWKMIWHENPQIDNPNLIYPGDVKRVATNSKENIPNVNTIKEIRRKKQILYKTRA